MTGRMGSIIPKIGALVIGQSPRPDVEAEFYRIAGNSATLVLRGALDGLSRNKINSLAPTDDADTLFTRLPDGDGLTISKRMVTLHGSTRLDALQADGMGVVIVLCTGTFPQWSDRKGVLSTSRIVEAMVGGCLPTGRIGVFSPLPEQCAHAETRWRDRGYDAVSVALSPNASEEEAIAAAIVMAGYAPELLVLDCVSYTHQTKQVVRSKAGVPAILGVSCAIRLALELVD